MQNFSKMTELKVDQKELEAKVLKFEEQYFTEKTYSYKCLCNLFLHIPHDYPIHELDNIVLLLLKYDKNIQSIIDIVKSLLKKFIVCKLCNASSSAYDNLIYYVVDCIAKTDIKLFLESDYNNRMVFNNIFSNRGLHNQYNFLTFDETKNVLKKYKYEYDFMKYFTLCKETDLKYHKDEINIMTCMNLVFRDKSYEYVEKLYKQKDKNIGKILLEHKIDEKILVDKIFHISAIKEYFVEKYKNVKFCANIFTTKNNFVPYIFQISSVYLLFTLIENKIYDSVNELDSSKEYLLLTKEFDHNYMVFKYNEFTD